MSGWPRFFLPMIAVVSCRGRAAVDEGVGALRQDGPQQND